MLLTRHRRHHLETCLEDIVVICITAYGIVMDGISADHRVSKVTTPMGTLLQRKGAHAAKLIERARLLGDSSIFAQQVQHAVR